MPGRDTLTPPSCLNGCYGNQPLGTDVAGYRYRPDRIIVTCSGCGDTTGWTPPEKFVIRCQHCERMFVNRWIPPVEKEYITYDDDRQTETRYTCNACKRKGLDEVDPEEVAEPEADEADEDDPPEPEPESEPDPEPIVVSVTDQDDDDDDGGQDDAAVERHEPRGPIEVDLGEDDDRPPFAERDLNEFERAVRERVRRR